MTSRSIRRCLSLVLDRLRPTWQRSDWQVRREAAQEMLDKVRLRQMAEKDADERVREEALRRLQDPGLDCEIASRRRQLLIAALVLLLIMAFARPPGGAGGMGPPRTNSGSLEFVDEVVGQLEFASIAFNAPTVVRLGDNAMIELVLSSNLSMEDLQREITAVGQRHGCRIHVANHMRAELWGDGFRSDAILPQEQLVGTTKTTHWRWNICAIRGGEQMLYLTLSAIFYLNDGTTPYVLKTLERTISVRVVWTRYIASLIGGHWQWAWTALLIPMVAWAIHKYKRRKRRIARRQRIILPFL